MAVWKWRWAVSVLVLSLSLCAGGADSRAAARHDAAVLAFDQAVFGAGTRSPPLGRAVQVVFPDSGKTLASPLRQTVEEIAGLSDGRLAVDGAAPGRITVSAAKTAPAACQTRREVWMNGVVRGEIAVDPDAPLSRARACLADRLLSLLGFERGTATGAEGLTAQERLLLRLLFSPDITPGMNRDAVLATVRQALDGVADDALCEAGFCQP